METPLTQLWLAVTEAKFLDGLRKLRRVSMRGYDSLRALVG